MLCECAFIDNANDVKCISTLEGQQAFGRAYAKAVLSYLNIVYKPMQPTSSASQSYVQVFSGSTAGAYTYAAKIKKLSIDGVPIPAVVKQIK